MRRSFMPRTTDVAEAPKVPKVAEVVIADPRRIGPVEAVVDGGRVIARGDGEDGEDDGVERAETVEGRAGEARGAPVTDPGTAATASVVLARTKLVSGACNEVLLKRDQAFGREGSLHSFHKPVQGITIDSSGSMTALVSRTGRHQQRYEHGYRLVAGCIPYRYKPTGEGKCMEVLMISSQRGEGLLFPKGGWENDETVEEAACREALEEAGVRGLLQDMLGSWDFKSKRQQGVFCPEGLCRAYMFALAVTDVLETWPEQHSRQRQWFAVSDAIGQCRHDWMRGALDQCVAYLAKIPSE